MQFLNNAVVMCVAKRFVVLTSVHFNALAQYSNKMIQVQGYWQRLVLAFLINIGLIL